MSREFCVSCGRSDLIKNEIGINKKLLGENIETKISYNKILVKDEVRIYGT